MNDFDWPADSWIDPSPFPVTDGTSLAVRLLPGDGHPFLLVHGLASNALLWRGVAEQLNSHGHPVACVDMRGHGRSERPDGGYSTASAAHDLGALVTALGWSDSHPIAAGQSWGGNVVLRAAHDDTSWGGVAAVDGGWIHLGRRFDSFDRCWAQLAPPDLTQRDPGEVISWIGAMVADWPSCALEAIAGNLEVGNGGIHNRLERRHHKSILHSLWADDPALLYPAIAAPVHLMVAGSTTSADVDEALAALPDATVSWHPDAHHDIHLQHPQVVTEHLLALLARVEES
ncbi:MAG: alpha/beta hydrolase [Actinomycetia bacterium]|nr:alpha/beta hydrolase [Actinomycetes bacterium]